MNITRFLWRVNEWFYCKPNLAREKLNMKRRCTERGRIVLMSREPTVVSQTSSAVFQSLKPHTALNMNTTYHIKYVLQKLKLS